MDSESDDISEPHQSDATKLPAEPPPYALPRLLNDHHSSEIGPGPEPTSHSIEMQWGIMVTHENRPRAGAYHEPLSRTQPQSWFFVTDDLGSRVELFAPPFGGAPV